MLLRISQLQIFFFDVHIMPPSNRGASWVTDTTPGLIGSFCVRYKWRFTVINHCLTAKFHCNEFSRRRVLGFTSPIAKTVFFLMVHIVECLIQWCLLQSIFLSNFIAGGRKANVGNGVVIHHLKYFLKLYN